ncbi:MAG: class I SAM-dependent methyltransferase [Fibrobacterota bacterium]
MTNTTNSDRFDEMAKAWDIAPQHVARTHDVANAIRRRIPLAGRSAIEIGAGTGLLSFALSNSLGSILATDPSQGMIDILADKIRHSGAGNIQALRCGDELGETTGPFDLAMLQMALHHIPDVPGFLARVHGKLGQGGTIAIADLDTEDGSFHGPEINDVHLGFDRTEIVNKLSEAGFEVVSIGTAHVMKRTVDGVVREYPIFLVVGRKKE